MTTATVTLAAHLTARIEHLTAALTAVTATGTHIASAMGGECPLTAKTRRLYVAIRTALDTLRGQLDADNVATKAAAAREAALKAQPAPTVNTNAAATLQGKHKAPTPAPMAAQTTAAPAPKAAAPAPAPVAPKATTPAMTRAAMLTALACHNFRNLYACTDERLAELVAQYAPKAAAAPAPVAPKAAPAAAQTTAAPAAKVPGKLAKLNALRAECKALGIDAQGTYDAVTARLAAHKAAPKAAAQTTAAPAPKAAPKAAPTMTPDRAALLAAIYAKLPAYVQTASLEDVRAVVALIGG